MCSVIQRSPGIAFGAIGPVIGDGGSAAIGAFLLGAPHATTAINANAHFMI
jgi:hypothetical protein